MSRNAELNYKLTHLSDVIELFESYNNTIATSLRNNIAQELYAIRVQMQTIIVKEGVNDEFTTIKKQLNQVISNIQFISNELLTEEKNNLNLYESFNNLALSMQVLDRFELQIHPTVLQLKVEFQQICFLIVKYIFLNTSWMYTGGFLKCSIDIIDNLAILKIEEKYNKEIALDSCNYEQQIILLKNGLKSFNFLFAEELQHSVINNGSNIMIRLNFIV